jgi:hypothetical protein
MREKELIVYRDFEDGELLYDMAFLMSHYDDEYYNTEDMAALFYEFQISPGSVSSPSLNRQMPPRSVSERT